MQIRSLSSDLGANVTPRALSGFDNLGSAGFASLLQQSQATPAPVAPEPVPPPPAPAPPPSAPPAPSPGRLPVQPPAPVAHGASSSTTSTDSPPAPNADTAPATSDSSGNPVDAPAEQQANAALAGKSPGGGSTRARPKAAESAAGTRNTPTAKATKTASGDVADRIQASTDKKTAADAGTSPAGASLAPGADPAPLPAPVAPPATATPIPAPVVESVPTAATTTAPSGIDPSAIGKTSASTLTDASRRIDVPAAKQEFAVPGATAAGATTAAATAPRLDAGFAVVLAEHRDGGLESSAATSPTDGAAAATPTVAAFGAAPAAAAGAAQAVDVPTPVASPDFARHLGAQLSVLAKGGVQQAELHLNPTDMGPVSVQITLDGTQARIDFGADVAATRHAIEAGLPQLAGALADAGLTLSGGGVSQHAGGRGDGGGEGRRDAEPGRTARPGAVDTMAAASAAPAPRRSVRIGGLDLYA